MFRVLAAVPTRDRGGEKPGYATARITLATFSTISPISSSLTIRGGVSARVSPATRSIRSLSGHALLARSDAPVPGARPGVPPNRFTLGQVDDIFGAAHERVVDGVAHHHAAHRGRPVGDALGKGDHVRHHAETCRGEGID